MRAGIRRSCSLSKKQKFFPKEATFALVSVTHWPKIHHTLSLRESLWEGNSLGQEELGKQANGESRASWLWTRVPRRLQPCPRVYSRRRAGNRPHKTLLHQKMPELLISSATPDFPRAVLCPWGSNWPAHPPLPATVADPASQGPSSRGEGKRGGVQDPMLTYCSCL